MRRLLDTLNRHLDIRLGLAPRLLLLAAAVLIGVTLTQPLWNLTMFAPQYQDGLRMDIYAHELQGGRNGQDIKEINLLNHYIGMRDLSNEDFTEFKWMPFALGILALLMLRVGGARVDGVARRLGRALRVFRRVLAVVVRLQDVHLRAHPGADGAGQGAAVLAARCSATSRSRTSRCTRTRARAPTCCWRRRCRSSSRWRVAWRAGTSERARREPRRRGVRLVMAHAPCAIVAISRPGRWRGRRRASAQDGRVSPLQARIDAAAPARASRSLPGTYPGNLVIGRPVRLVGLGRPLLLGAGDGTVVTIAAPGRDGRGVRRRRAEGRGSRPRRVRDPGGGAPRHDPRLPRAERAVRHLPEAGAGQPGGALRASAESRRRRRGRRGPASTSGIRTASRCSTTTSWTCATASTSSPPRTA